MCVAEGVEMDVGEQRTGSPAGDWRASARRRLAEEGVDALTHKEWDALSTMWAEVARFSLGHGEEATRYGLVWLAGLVGASVSAVSLLAHTTPFAPRRLRTLGGWQPVYHLTMSGDGRELDHELDRLHKPAVYARDPVFQRAVAEVGRRRAYLLREMVDEESFASSPTKAIMERLGSSDRLCAMLPLRPTLEAAVFLDRPHGAPPFTTRDRCLLLEALRGFESTLISLGRTAGYVDCQGPLTPKERLVLTHLLTGRREAEIAQELRMGRRSLHQRVVDVYRKFGVSSRPELMALWLSSTV